MFAVGVSGRFLANSCCILVVTLTAITKLHPRETRTSAGTLLGANKETREIEGKVHVLETPLKGDVALVKADAGDRWGNLTYNKSARNFGPTMAMAAKLTIAEVKTIKELGEICPEHVVTPGIFVDRVIKLREEQCTRHLIENKLLGASLRKLKREVMSI